MKKTVLIMLFLLLLAGCENVNKEINLFENLTIQNTELTDKDDSRWSWFINPGEYTNIKLFDKNFIGVQNESGKYGFINNKKELIVDYQFFNILGVSEGIARVLNYDKNYLYIDNEGDLISKSTFEDARDFSEGYAAVKNNEGKWGFINTAGKLVIEYQFDDILEGFYEGYAAVKINSKWSFIDKKGTFAFSEQFDVAHNFSSGYAAVKNGSKWGFIDKNGDLVIGFEYDGVGKFSEEKVAVKLIFEDGEKWAYINKNNEIIIDFYQYDASEGRLLTVGEFKDGYALVTDIVYCLMDSQGKIILGNDSYFLPGGGIYNKQYDMIVAYDYSDDTMVNKKYGFIDINGALVIPFIFEHTSDICGNLSQVLVNDGGTERVGVIKIHNVDEQKPIETD